MSYPSTRYHEPEPARVQHGRSFVQAHGPSSVTVSTARSLHSGQQQPQAQAQFRAGGGGGVLPAKAVTSASSTRGGNSLNTTRIDARTGHTLNASQRMQPQSAQVHPLPPSALHPNHITDVFPDALTALAKAEEHTYSSALNPATLGGEQHAHGHSHTHSHQPHNPYVATNPSHHKVPLRMPMGPSAPPQPPSNGVGQGNLNLTQSGMEDSVYSIANGHANAGIVLPGAADNTTLNGSGMPHLQAALNSDRVVPLQRENLRLVRSNNALQAHLVAEGEAIDVKEKQWSTEMRNIKTKHQELQFLHAQKTRKIANQEQKISELQARLEQVMSDRQAYVKESVEVSSRLQSGPIVAAPSFRPQSVSQSLSNSAVDQLRQHESKIAELTAELAVANARASDWESERSTLLSRIETRDGEVKRLAEVLESERNWDKMQAEAALKAQHKQIHKLEVQLDYLNSARKDWERDAQSFKEHGVSAHFVSQLQESRAQTQQARHEAEQSAQRVEQLHAQLEQARASISTLEASKIGVDERVHRAVQEQEQHAREEIAQLQASFAQLQSKLSESEQAHLDAQSKITSLEHELHLVRHAASSKTSELNSKQTLLAHNSELVATLNAQILELRQAVRSVESQKAKVESEWRLAMQELEQTKVALHQAMDSTTATGIGLQSKVQEMLAIRVQNDQLASEKHALEVELSARDQRIQSLVAEAQANQTERQQLLQSLGQADETLSTVQGEVSNLHSELQQKEQAYANLSADFEQRSAQLDELRSSKFPSLQGQMAQLKAEKDKLAAQLHDLQSHTLATATQELQSSKAEVVRLQSNQTELLSRLEDAQAKTAEAEARHTALERELHALRHASGTKSTQLSSHAALIEHHADTIARLNLTITDLKSLCRSTESQRATLESEWKASLAEVERLKRELGLQMDLHGNHSLVLASKGQEVVELKAQISSMAEEAQRQHFELQQRDRRIEQMQSQVQSVQEGSKQLSHLVDERGEQSSALQDALRAKEYELNDLSSQLSTLQRAHQKAQQDLALKDADLKAMLSDLENILRENQVLTAELSQSRQAKEVTTLDAERQATRASHAEELFRAKESECLDLLSNYRAVCLENERVKLAGNELENERANHRQQLKQQQDALFKQEVALKAAEGELRARMLDLHANEQAMQEMSRALEAQKRALDSAHAEKRDLSSQLEAARMVATGLEQGRTEQGRLLAENRSALAKAQIDAQSAAMDGAHLTHSLAQAKAHHANLEHIIASLRAQAYDASQLHAQALAEKSARVSTLTQELQQARIHADTMQEQINTLNQYREKQNQEINRLLQSAAASSVAGGKSSSSSSVAASPEVLSQLTSLQGVVDAQFARLQELQKEKAKLKGYMVKYEAELRSWEKKGAAAQAHAQQQQQQQQQQQPQAIGSPGAHAAAAANVNASHRIDHSSVLSPGQPAQQQQQQQAHAAAGQQQQQLQHSVVNQSSASFLVQHP